VTDRERTGTVKGTGTGTAIGGGRSGQRAASANVTASTSGGPTRSDVVLSLRARRVNLKFSRLSFSSRLCAQSSKGQCKHVCTASPATACPGSAMCAAALGVGYASRGYLTDTQETGRKDGQIRDAAPADEGPEVMAVDGGDVNLGGDITSDEMQMMMSMGIPFGFDTTQASIHVGSCLLDSNCCRCAPKLVQSG